MKNLGKLEDWLSNFSVQVKMIKMQGWNNFRQNLNLNIVNVESVDYRIIFVKFVLGK